jgi:hypothetical protein
MSCKWGGSEPATTWSAAVVGALLWVCFRRPKAWDVILYKRGPKMGYKGMLVRDEDQIVTIRDSIVMIKGFECKY